MSLSTPELKAAALSFGLVTLTLITSGSPLTSTDRATALSVFSVEVAVQGGLADIEVVTVSSTSLDTVILAQEGFSTGSVSAFEAVGIEDLFFKNSADLNYDLFSVSSEYVLSSISGEFTITQVDLKSTFTSETKSASITGQQKTEITSTTGKMEF